MSQTKVPKACGPTYPATWQLWTLGKTLNLSELWLLLLEKLE